MEPISSLRFYHKGCVTVVPSNNVDSDGSSSDDEEVALPNKTLKSPKKKVLTEAKPDDESRSPSRWATDGSGTSHVSETSVEEVEEQKISSKPRLRRKRITSVQVTDRFRSRPRSNGERVKRSLFPENPPGSRESSDSNPSYLRPVLTFSSDSDIFATENEYDSKKDNNDQSSTAAVQPRALKPSKERSDSASKNLQQKTVSSISPRQTSIIAKSQRASKLTDTVCAAAVPLKEILQQKITSSQSQRQTTTRFMRKMSLISSSTVAGETSKRLPDTRNAAFTGQQKKLISNDPSVDKNVTVDSVNLDLSDGLKNKTQSPSKHLSCSVAAPVKKNLQQNTMTCKGQVQRSIRSKRKISSPESSTSAGETSTKHNAESSIVVLTDASDNVQNNVSKGDVNIPTNLLNRNISDVGKGKENISTQQNGSKVGLRNVSGRFLPKRLISSSSSSFQGGTPNAVLSDKPKEPFTDVLNVEKNIRPDFVIPEISNGLKNKTQSPSKHLSCSVAAPVKKNLQQNTMTCKGQVQRSIRSKRKISSPESSTSAGDTSTKHNAESSIAVLTDASDNVQNNVSKGDENIPTNLLNRNISDVGKGKENISTQQNGSKVGLRNVSGRFLPKRLISSSSSSFQGGTPNAVLTDTAKKAFNNVLNVKKNIATDCVNPDSSDGLKNKTQSPSKLPHPSRSVAAPVKKNLQQNTMASKSRVQRSIHSKCSRLSLLESSTSAAASKSGSQSASNQSGLIVQVTSSSALLGRTPENERSLPLPDLSPATSQSGLPGEILLSSTPVFEKQLPSMDMSQIVSPIDSIPFDLSTNVEELADSEALLATPEQGPLQRNDLGTMSKVQMSARRRTKKQRDNTMMPKPKRKSNVNTNRRQSLSSANSSAIANNRHLLVPSSPTNLTDTNENVEEDTENIEEDQECIPSGSNTGATKRRKKKGAIDYEWKEGDIPEKVLEEHPPFSIPMEQMEPIDYFRYYLDEEILSLIVAQTNLYSTQKDGICMNVTEDEIKAFIGIILFMGVLSLPNLEDYWSADCQVKQVASVMSVKRFKKIHSHIHFVDNLEEPGTNPYRKASPILNHLRAKCQNLEQEVTLSIDEGMVRYKGKFAGQLRQYLPQKPSTKWGFKLFGLAGVSGMLYDFIFYSGSRTFDNENLSPQELNMGVGASAVIALCKSIKSPTTCTLTFDNWYTGVPLLVYLRNHMGIYSLGTIKPNRTEECPLPSDKELLSQHRRGICASQVNKDGVIIIKWVDNKVVLVAGTRCGVEPMGTVSRWDKASKSRVTVSIPRAIVLYNSSMGGVDLSDQYRCMLPTPSRSKRWYYPLFGFFVDIAIVNAYLQYKRDSALLKVKKPTYDTLKKFKLSVSQALVASAPLQKSRGRPRLNKALSHHQVKRPVVHRPADALRTDGYNHWIESDPKQHRCRYCSGYTRSKCTKCDVFLCYVVNGRNCFNQFHIQKSIIRKKKSTTQDSENDTGSELDGDVGDYGFQEETENDAGSERDSTLDE